MLKAGRCGMGVLLPYVPWGFIAKIMWATAYKQPSTPISLGVGVANAIQPASVVMRVVHECVGIYAVSAYVVVYHSLITHPLSLLSLSLCVISLLVLVQCVRTTRLSISSTT